MPGTKGSRAAPETRERRGRTRAGAMTKRGARGGEACRDGAPTPRGVPGACRCDARRPLAAPVTELRELLDLGENLVGLRQLALAVALDEADLPLFVDDERCADVGVPVGPVDAVVLGDRALHVREQRVVADADRLRPVLMAEGAVRADTQHLGIRRLQVAHALVEGGHAGASARCPV